MDLKFELGAMHRHEQSIRNLLLSTLNVSDLDNVTRSAVRVGNKDYVVDFAVKLATLLKTSRDLLRSAAADLDSLKREQLQCQSKLLSVQDELSVKKSAQLDAVKDTVEEKMSSWAAVVKKNSSSKVTQKEMKKAVKSAINESDREYNVIMFNVEEQEEEDPSENYDADTALDIMNSAGLEAFEGEYTTERIGALHNDKNRPLKVKFDFKTTAFELLAKSKNLKDSEVYGTVFIVPDRSREERVEHRKLVEQLKLIRTQNPEKRCYIWNKAVHTEEY
jgi:CHASE3 domain sensor protein